MTNEETRDLRLTAFQYALDILTRPELAMYIRNAGEDLFALSDRIYNYFVTGQQNIA